MVKKNAPPAEASGAYSQRLGLSLFLGRAGSLVESQFEQSGCR